MQHPRASQGRSHLSYAHHGVGRLTELCHANGLSAELDRVVELFTKMTAPWAARAIQGPAGEWVSDVADDHTPYEFSVVYGGAAPELRMLIEAQGDPPSLVTNWEAGLELSRRLAAEYDLPLDRHDRIAEIFEPRAGARLGIWHAVGFRPGLPPEFKVYFDSQARGRWLAPAVMEEALARLGFARAWPAARSVGARGLELDELRYLSLDLARSAHARVKVYWRHHKARAAELGRFVGETGAGEREIAEFCSVLTGFEGPYSIRPVFSCATLVDETSSQIHSSTLYVPVAAYSPSDAVGVERVRRCLARCGIDEDRYLTTIGRYAPRDLQQTSSLQSYVSLQRRHGRAQVTVYFSPEAHVVQPSREVTVLLPVAPVVPGAEEIVRRYENDVVLEDHPFLRRLGREPVDLGRLWLIVANFWEAIVHDFPARLAGVVARVDDDHIRCILTKQLNDELGEGDFARAHKPMFQRLLAALEPHRLDGDDQRLLAPGREFGRRLRAHLQGPDAYEAVGALMMIEIYGKQTDVRLGIEFRRQDLLETTALTWLHLHETLEVDHADDSLRLARLLPAANGEADATSALEAVWRGAEGVVAASHEYFDALYAVCYA